MGLQKGKISDNQNDMGLAKCHHIVTNTAQGCAASEKSSKFLDIPLLSGGILFMEAKMISKQT